MRVSLPALSFRAAVAVIVLASFGALLWRGGASRQLGPIVPLLFASGLDQPRALAFAPDGTLYVAEAGTGGGGRLSALSLAGARTTLIESLPGAEAAQSLFAQSGPSALARGDAAGDTPLFLATGPHDGAPLGDLSRVARSDSRWRVEPVDAFSSTLSESSPPSAAWGASVARDGTVYIAFPVANLVARAQPATAAGTGPVRISPLTGFIGSGQSNPYPTGTAVAPDGSLYVTLMGSDPPRPGAGSVVRVDSSGRWQPQFEGLSFPIALAFSPDGQLWVLEYASGYDARTRSYTPRSGRLLAVGPSTLRRRTAILSVNYPTALAFSPSGDAFVTENAVDSTPGAGRVLRVVSQSLRALR